MQRKVKVEPSTAITSQLVTCQSIMMTPLTAPSELRVGGNEYLSPRLGI